MAHIHELYDFTASAIVLHPSEPKVCLIFHKKLQSWLQPGGHIELHEDPIEGLVHELQEEVGLKPEDYDIESTEEVPVIRGSKALPIPIHLNVHPYDDVHKHIDLMYLVRSHTDKLAPEEGESTRIGWFNIEQIREMHANGTVLDGTLDIFEWFFTRYV